MEENKEESVRISKEDLTFLWRCVFEARHQATRHRGASARKQNLIYDLEAIDNFLSPAVEFLLKKSEQNNSCRT